MSHTFETMLACLLSGFGELLYRAELGSGRPEERFVTYFKGILPENVLEAIRYHQMEDDPENRRNLRSLSAIVHAANQIALGGKTRSPDKNHEPQQNGTALESIFNHLNQGHGQSRYLASWPEESVQYSSEHAHNDVASCREVLARWESGMNSDLFRPSHSNALLDLLERCFIYMPSAAYDDDRCDVSMFHHCRAAAAIGCCIERWLDANSSLDDKEVFDSDGFILPHNKPFLLYSLDLSGIQSFIYTISNKGALKGLRARSFYLFMLMEHISDMILESCALFRVNLVYAGGGRAQLLLPNDGQCLLRANEIIAEVNCFLRERFGTALFLASGASELSAAELASADEDSRCLSDAFRAASFEISEQKLRRYGPDALLRFNQKAHQPLSERECIVCGASGRLLPHGDEENICETCSRLEKFSNTLTGNAFFLDISHMERDDALPLPGNLWLSWSRRNEHDPESFRTYCINGDHALLPRTVWLSIGNYRALNDDGSSMSFDQLAEASSGIKRLGVLRADVDNLGTMFATGFSVPGITNPHRYETLPRYMALSSAMTAFFQKEINRFVERGTASWVPEADVPENRHVTIVYSGGDDVFLVGAWNEVLDTGLAVQGAFSQYTGGNVTLSAGFGMFPPHEPVGVLANTTGDLEEEAKLIEDGTKNAIALFAPAAASKQRISFVFHWDDLRERVFGRMVQLLHRTFSTSNDDERAAGNAFLYRVLTLLREVQSKPIAIARLAYLLARNVEKGDKTIMEQFSRDVYRWALNPEDNLALQTAILLHVYAHRGRRDGDV